MEHNYRKLKFIYLFFSIYASTNTCIAQNIHAAASPYHVFQKEGQIILSDGKNEEKISATGANDTLPILDGNEVYFVSNPAKNTTATVSTIVAYNINDKNKLDILNVAGNADYTFKDAIVSMMLDKVSGRIYFSTVSINRKGLPDFMTWLYDINSTTLSIYKDGLLQSIDQAGKQTIVFYGLDYKGKYAKKNVYAKDGTISESFDKEYSSY